MIFAVFFLHSLTRCRLLRLLPLCLVMLLGAGCSDAPTKEKGSTVSPIATAKVNAPEKPVDGGRIVFGSIGEPTNLIPMLATDTASAEICDMLYVAPLRYNKDIEVEPWAAQSYEILDGGRLLRFTLRQGILWQDGVELSADDVAFTYKLMIDPKTPTAYAESFLNIKEFRQTGRYSFEVYYEKPYARALTTWMSAILPRHLLEGADLTSTPLLRKPVGAGAYRLKNWESGSTLVLEASPSYFEGKAHIEQLVFRIIPDMSTMFMELKADKVDMMSLTPQQYLRQTQGALWDAQWRKYRYLSFSYTYLGYNLALPMFADVRVRQALAYAINREDIIKGVLLGEGEPSVGPYKPGTWAYNQSLHPYAPNPQKARELLAAAGWKDTDNDGLLDKNGQTFSFTILTNQGNDQRVKAATIIQSQLAELGIDVRIRTVEWAAFLKEFVDKKRFDAVLLAWTIPQDPDAYDVWHSSRAKPGGLNFISYQNPEVDTLLEQARTTTDQAQRKILYDRFQEILYREQPYCFLYVPYALPIVQARFHGIHAAPAGIMYNFTEWWVPSSLQRYHSGQSK